MKRPATRPRPDVYGRLEHQSLKRPSTLQLALGISLALHGLLLALRLADPVRFERLFEDAPLEVILVNSQTKAKPDKAQLAV